MDRVFCVTLALVVFVTPVTSTSGLRSVTKTQVLGFDWKNCGAPEAPAVLQTLTLAPDPVSIPGPLRASASGATAVQLAAPLAVNVTLEKEVAGFWVHVPCVEEVGSCHYEDVCELLTQLTPPGQDCPEPLHTYGLPCRCPFKAGSYSLPLSDFQLPVLELPSWLTNGNYRVLAALGSRGAALGCLQVSLSLRSD